MGVRDDLLAIPDEVLRTGRIGQAALVWMDFAGGAKRWWTGFGDLETAGHTWQGLGDLIGISPIQTSYNLSAKPVTFTLACTPEMLALAINAAGSTEPEAVRAALAGVRGYQGAEGEYNYDERGDGLRGYNIVRNDGGKVVFDRRIEFKD